MFWLYVILSVPIYYALRYLWDLFPLGDLDKRAVFISGCDTGFGRMLAVKLASRKIPTYAGCLTKEGEKSLNQFAEKQGFAGYLTTVPLDVTSDQAVEKAVQLVREHLPKNQMLWALVNNAGIFSCYGPDEWTPMEDYRKSMEVNLFGAIRCTRAFLPLLKQCEGRIIAISSVAGRVSVPCGAPYACAKYGVEAYIDAIRLELTHFGVTCHLLEPGTVRTMLIDQKEMHKRVEAVWAKLSPALKEEYGEKWKNDFIRYWNSFLVDHSTDNYEWVVDSYYHAIVGRWPRLRYRCGWDAILVFIPLSFLPTEFADWIYRKYALQKMTIPAAVLKKWKAEGRL